MKKRFKILFHLAIRLKNKNFLDKLRELSERIDNEDSQAEEALTYYEDEILKILE